jgi:hypothetical protein
LRELKLDWDQATAVNLYTVHEVHHVLAPILLPALGAAAQVGELALLAPAGDRP